MNLIMFDIDGTLVESIDLTTDCYAIAVRDELGLDFYGNWGTFQNVTDSGVLKEMLVTHKIQTSFTTVEQAVKQRFISLMKSSLNKNPLSQIKGANDFLEALKQQDHVQLAMATGAWKEAALLKLDAAGINYQGIPIATSNDHFARIDIMRLAESKTRQSDYRNRIYFGDGIWDKRTCTELAYDFIAIGQGVEHHIRYQDFSAIDFDKFIASL